MLLASGAPGSRICETLQSDCGGAPNSFWRVSRIPRPGIRETFKHDVGGFSNSFWKVLGSPGPGPGKPSKTVWDAHSFGRVSRVPRLGAREKPSKTKSEALRHRFGGSGLWKPSKMTSGVPRTRFGGFPGSARPVIRETPENDFGDAPIVLKGCPGPGPGDPGNSSKRLRGRSDIVLERFPDPPAQHPGNRPKRRRGQPAIVLEEFPGSPGPGPEKLSKATSAPNSF